MRWGVRGEKKGRSVEGPRALTVPHTLKQLPGVGSGPPTCVSAFRGG